MTFGALLPSSAVAQAICSAPHSSPTLAQSGEVGTLDPGAGWIQLSLNGQRATEFYGSTGERRPFLADAEFNTRSLFITAAYGVTEGLELWAQMPTHRLSINASSGTSASNGVGDLRFAARMGAELMGIDAPIALRVGAKVPGSDFPVDATVIPLTEGQIDMEVSLESGAKLGSLPVYVAGWVGYRLRGANREAVRRPGSERFAHLAVGGFAGDLTWELAADGMWGDAPRASGILLPSEKRRMVLLLPTLGYAVGPGRLEATAQIPVEGRALPAATGLSVGYRVGWGL
jgi:hypothetical protein